MPYYYGSPTGRDDWGEWNFNEMSASVGLSPWMLLPVALVARRRDTAFFGLMALSAGALFYGVVAEWVDTGFFIISFRLAPLMVFPLCVLGAIGMDALLTEPRRTPPWASTAVRIGFAALVALAFLSLTSDYATMREGLRMAGPLQYLYFLALVTASAVLTLAGIHGTGSGWALALIVVQLASLAPLAATYNPIIDTRLLYPTPPAVARLQDEASGAPGRVLMAPNLAMLYGLYGVAGYDGMTPRHLEEVVRPTQSQLNFVGSGYLPEVPIFLSPVRDLLGFATSWFPPASPSMGRGCPWNTKRPTGESIAVTLRSLARLSCPARVASGTSRRSASSGSARLTSAGRYSWLGAPRRHWRATAHPPPPRRSITTRHIAW